MLHGSYQQMAHKMWQHKILRMELVKYLLCPIAAALLRALFYQNGLHVRV